MLLANAVLLWLYTMSCHACRHPIRYRFWTVVTTLNPYHGMFAWASLVWVG